MTKLNMNTEIDSESIAMEIATNWTTEDIRKFIDKICNECQMLELDEALLVDRFREVSKHYNGNYDGAYEEKLDIQELLEQYPELDKE